MSPKLIFRQKQLSDKGHRLMRECNRLSVEALVFQVMAILLIVASIWSVITLLWVGWLALIIGGVWDVRSRRKRREVDLIMAELKGMQLVMEDVLKRIKDEE